MPRLNSSSKRKGSQTDEGNKSGKCDVPKKSSSRITKSKDKEKEENISHEDIALSKTAKSSYIKNSKSQRRNKSTSKPAKSLKQTNSRGKGRFNGSSVAEPTLQHYPGCHISAAGGVDNAIGNALQINAKSFALFLRNQRSWNTKPLEPKVAEEFRRKCAENNFPPHLIIPHGSYLVNLGSPKLETRQKSVDTFIDELKRCSMLGLTLFNIHPGSSCGEISRQECIKFIAQGINKALSETSGVKVVLENMSKQGNTIGGDLAELREIMDLIDDKSRIGVCIDTCHAMAAGYDLSTEQGFNSLIEDIDKHIGFEWLVALHLNDSKGPAGCHLDRHENIGKGKIGIEGFKRIMNSKYFTDIPLILETPYSGPEIYEKEIKLLSSLSESQ